LEFDPRDPQHAIDGVPFATLKHIRAEEPICRTPTQGWFISRREEIMTCLHEVTIFVADLAPLSGLSSYRDISTDELFLSEIEEPRHGQIRRLYNSCFARHRLNTLGSFIEDSCHHLLDRLFAAEDGIADLHVGYAMPIPSLALARLMGLPAEAAERFMEFALDGTLMQRRATPGVAAGGPPIQQYFAEHLARRRQEGNTGARDIYQSLIEAEIEGAPLSDQEIITQLQFMVMAGVHTTRSLLTHLVHRLLFQPDLAQTLRDDPSLIPNYVEESLRHDSPVQATSRRCTQDFELGGTKIARGDWLEVGLGSGNRDERAYTDPEVFRLDREDPRDHLAFGAGSHICPGAALARLEAQTCVAVLLERTAELNPVEGVQYPPLPSSLSDLPIPAHLTAAG
jgi:cytochrome P450